MHAVATIVLAAGYSSRMQGAFKPLLTLGDYPVVQHVLRAHRDAGIQDIRIVVGYRADDVVAAVKHCDVRIVPNPDFDQGMISSVRAGLATLEPGIQAFFIQPVDIPLVDPCSMRAVLDRYEQEPCGIVYPTYRGKKGHPPLISRRFIPEIMTSPARDGLRGILNSHAADARTVEVQDEAVVLDIDTLKDYHQMLRFLDRMSLPDQAQCLRLLEQANVPEQVWEHCHQVNAVASRLVQRLNHAGADLNAKLVSAAALLHDIKRDQKDHARAGAMYLRACGHARVADIVAAHMDIELAEGSSPTEAEIVYLADKLVMGRRQVSLQERFTIALQRHRDDEMALQSILRRLEQAEKIKKKVEVILGCTVEDLPSGHPAVFEYDTREARIDA